MPGGAFWDPAADAGFLASLRAHLRPDIPISTHALHINATEFALAVADRFVALLSPERNIRMTVPVPVQLPSNNMADLAYPDIQAYLKVCDLVLVPMASTEQHGPHLPLSTDTVTAFEVASRVAKINNMLHTPAIWTGYSPQHMAGPGEGRGTITIRSSTLQALLYDIARSLIHHGFNKILFINGHGSNVKVIDPVLRKIRYDTGAMVGFCMPYMERYVGLMEGLMENPKDETPGWHASELETSQMLAHNTDMVRMDRAVKTLTQIPQWLPQDVRQEGRRARHPVRGLQLLPVPDGSPRVHRQRRHRQPRARHGGEGRGGVPPLRRARRQGGRRRCSASK